MSFSDWINSVFGGRRASIDKTTSVTEPGEMTKELFSAMSAFRIVEHDCGTREGIEMDLDDADALDYCLAEDVYSDGRLIAKRNSPLTDDVVNALQSHRIKKVKVRTPLTCKSIDGVCQLCYGLDKLGKFPSIGEYVGVKAAEYIGEPMTQLILSRAHYGGTKGAPSLTGFKIFESLINFSPHIRPKATLAYVDGKVQKILINPDGSKSIIINGVDHPVSRESLVLVRVGDTVKKGQQLSEGIPHPVDVYNTRGLMEMRKYLSTQLRKIYQDSGIKIDKRMFDVLAKAMTNTVVITNPGNSNLVVGDRVSLDMVEKLNKEPQLMDIHDAIGEKLAEPIGPYPKGTKITEDIAKDIYKHGYRQVKVERRKIEYKPVFRGLPQQVLLSTDWLNRISRKDIKNTLIEGTIRQWTGDISRYPMPAFAYGVELK
jgi:DNA-directed RNA polymerase subunit beta'